MLNYGQEFLKCSNLEFLEVAIVKKMSLSDISSTVETAQLFESTNMTQRSCKG